MRSVFVIQRPCQVEKEEQYGFACFSGPLSVTVQTDRKGFCPGESIAVSAFINNQSSCKVNGVEIALVQISVYTIKAGMVFVYFLDLQNVILIYYALNNSSL